MILSRLVMKKLLILAAILYCFIAPLTHHPDNKTVLFWAGLEHGSVWNIWEYGQQHLSDQLQFNYPPLHFYLDKLQYALVSPIGGDGYYEWLSSPNKSDPDEPNLARYAFATKLGLIGFGLMAGYLLYLLAKQHGANEKVAKYVAALWLFNPVVIYSIPIMGQNDVMAIVFFLAGWYLLAKKGWAAAIAFGLSASIKTYPLIWLPFLLLTAHSLSLKKKIALFTGSVGVYLLTLMPFISNPIFRKFVLNSDLNNRFFISQIGLGFSESVHLVPLLLMLVFFAAAVKQPKEKAQIGFQALILMTLNLLLLGFSHFHPQWYTWVIPFWALWLAGLRRSHQAWILAFTGLAVAAWAVVILLFYNDASLSYGLFIPINPSLANLPVLRDFMAMRGMDPLRFNNYAHTWLAATGLLSLATLFHFQDFSSSGWQTVFSWRYSLTKLIKVPLVIGGLALLMYGFTVLLFMVPVPRSSPAPVVVDYLPISHPVTTSFRADYQNLTRVDLFFQNIDLKNRDPFELVVTDENQDLVARKEFSGFNAGFQSSIRFDIPPQPTAENRLYTLEIKPLAASPSSDLLEIGLTKLQDPAAIAVQTYYPLPSGIQSRFKSAFEADVGIIRQLPWLYGILIVSLLIIL